MPSGGKREGAGRKPGSVTKRTREIADKAAAEGITPLEYMLSMLRNEQETQANRMWAAEKAAPYVHPKLAAVEHRGEIGQRHSLADITDEQLAAIAAGRSARTTASSPRPEELN